MVFSSYLFLFYFLPAALALYYAAPRRAKHLVLTLVSYVFYGWANPLFITLLLVSTVIDYVAGLVIAGGHAARASAAAPLDPDGPRTARQRAALVASIVTNLGLLGFFKYSNFAAANVDALARALGLPAPELSGALRVTLPLGISFYTFQSMSYTFDVYLGRAAAIRSFVDFACYVSMFPQLVAGPIIRFREVADQLRDRTHTAAKFARGVAFFSLGLAKKVILANPCGKIADLAFEAGALGVWDAWFGVTAYAFQIYFDFSGYSDMAIGLGLMFGFVFPKNFDSPYRSQSITEFWRRWHISLSTWLRDYLYLPLGGNRKGPRRTYANLFIVMLLGGLWHGAAWHFVLWGGLHGVLLALERARGKRTVYEGLPRPLRVACTFVIVLVTWVFFRAPDLPAALRYAGAMVGLGGAGDGTDLMAGLLYRPYYVATWAAAALVTWTAPQTWDWTRSLPAWKAVLVAAVLLVGIVILTTQAYNPFIYFIF
jgi:alginate O-acetyltransferase complex protein AlgI